MTERRCKDWLKSFVQYASHTESPRIMHFYAGVGAIAGALRRKVWIDQAYFRWYPGFFIIFVAPPGIVSKSTTADIAMDLLREVPGIKFGPDVVTWPALVSAFAASCESFVLNEEYHPMSPITLVASELGNLINPQDKDMINLFINLWDGRKSLEKVTKGAGNDTVEAPWINMLGCTTPHWIADNMPAATVGGGFTSRCIFVYADKKERYIAYPKFHVPQGQDQLRADLIHDLEHISTNLCGEFILTPDAVEWGTNWYKALWTHRPDYLEDDRLEGYLARKQTHLHKLAMVISASASDSLTITADNLQLADQMLTTVETDLGKVFSRIGRSEDSLQVERLIQFVVKKGEVPYSEAYRLIHSFFPDFRDFEGIVSGVVRAGFLALTTRPDGFWISATPAAMEAAAKAEERKREILAQMVNTPYETK